MSKTYFPNEQISVGGSSAMESGGKIIIHPSIYDRSCILTPQEADMLGRFLIHLSEKIRAKQVTEER